MQQQADIIFRDRAVIQLDSVDSTNNYAATVLRQSKPPEGSAILAQEQLAGRGQRGNAWESEAGTNLLCSVLLYPQFLDAAHHFYLSKCVSLALAGAVEEISGLDVFIKWPNDIVAKSKKIGGILIESSWSESMLQNTIAGIGLNLNQKEFSVAHASSLRNFTKKTFAPEKVFDVLMKHLAKWYGELKASNFRELDNGYRIALYRLGVTGRFLYKGETVLGMITGVDRSGHLQVYTEKGKSLNCALKEIAMVW